MREKTARLEKSLAEAGTSHGFAGLRTSIRQRTCPRVWLVEILGAVTEKQIPLHVTQRRDRLSCLASCVQRASAYSRFLRQCLEI
jgi:hypothetical protein